MISRLTSKVMVRDAFRRLVVVVVMMKVMQ